MSVDNIGNPIGLPPLVSPATRPRPVASPATAPAAPVDTVQLSLPASPPDEVLDAIGAAADRADALAAQDRQLHFEMDERTNRVIIEVRDLDGNVLKTIPPAKALDIMSGGEL
jgi:flagellar protein FlaG